MPNASMGTSCNAAPRNRRRRRGPSDVAAIELALARARTFRPTAMETASLAACPQSSAHLWYRAHPCLALLHCRYDVRSLFESGRHRGPVTQRPVGLAVLAARGRRQPMVAELEPEPFGLLERSAAWSRLAPDAERRERTTPTPPWSNGWPLRDSCW